MASGQGGPSPFGQPPCGLKFMQDPMLYQDPTLCRRKKKSLARTSTTSFPYQAGLNHRVKQDPHEGGQRPSIVVMSEIARPNSVEEEEAVLWQPSRTRVRNAQPERSASWIKPTFAETRLPQLRGRMRTMVLAVEDLLPAELEYIGRIKAYIKEVLADEVQQLACKGFLTDQIISSTKNMAHWVDSWTEQNELPSKCSDIDVQRAISSQTQQSSTCQPPSARLAGANANLSSEIDLLNLDKYHQQALTKVKLSTSSPRPPPHTPSNLPTSEGPQSHSSDGPSLEKCVTFADPQISHPYQAQAPSPRGDASPIMEIQSLSNPPVGRRGLLINALHNDRRKMAERLDQVELELQKYGAMRNLQQAWAPAPPFQAEITNRGRSVHKLTFHDKHTDLIISDPSINLGNSLQRPTRESVLAIAEALPTPTARIHTSEEGENSSPCAAATRRRSVANVAKDNEESRRSFETATSIPNAGQRRSSATEISSQQNGMVGSGRNSASAGDVNILGAACPGRNPRRPYPSYPPPPPGLVHFQPVHYGGGTAIWPSTGESNGGNPVRPLLSTIMSRSNIASDTSQALTQHSRVKTVLLRDTRFVSLRRSNSKDERIRVLRFRALLRRESQLWCHVAEQIQKRIADIVVERDRLQHFMLTMNAAKRKPLLRRAVDSSLPTIQSSNCQDSMEFPLHFEEDDHPSVSESLIANAQNSGTTRGLTERAKRFADFEAIRVSLNEEEPAHGISKTAREGGNPTLILLNPGNPVQESRGTAGDVQQPTASGLTHQGQAGSSTGFIPTAPTAAESLDTPGSSADLAAPSSPNTIPTKIHVQILPSRIRNSPEGAIPSDSSQLRTSNTDYTPGSKTVLVKIPSLFSHQHEPLGKQRPSSSAQRPPGGTPWPGLDAIGGGHVSVAPARPPHSFNSNSHGKRRNPTGSATPLATSAYASGLASMKGRVANDQNDKIARGNVSTTPAPIPTGKERSQLKRTADTGAVASDNGEGSQNWRAAKKLKITAEAETG